MYPVCNPHVPRCHLWPVQLYSIFSHYLTNGKIFDKKVTEHKMCVLIESTTFFLKHSSFQEELSEI